tara:strand:- start:2295 stop:2570 length:276 start_codon:yes stop_codon:yes gene_type:complete
MQIKNMAYWKAKNNISPLKHDMDEEHAHQEEASRSSRNYITVSGKRGEQSMWNEDIRTGHSSTQGTYADLDKKTREAEIKKIRASQKKKNK